MQLLTLPLLLVLTVATSAVYGVEIERITRIVNGQPVPKGRATWQVSIQLRFGNIHFCGGTLINDNWVVTACHCTLDKTPGEIQVGIGGNNLNDLKHRDVKRIIRHENYSKTTLQNDIALLELYPTENSLFRDDSIQKIKIETRLDMTKVPCKCYVTGFGRLSEGGQRATVMQEAQVPLYTDDQCYNVYAKYIHTNGVYLSQRQVCAGGKDKDACQGDSGGPLVCCTGDLDMDNSECSLVGVTSWGVGCATEGFPGVYTRVATFKDWINAKITNNKDFVDESYTGLNFLEQLHNYWTAILPLSDKEAEEEGETNEEGETDSVKRRQKVGGSNEIEIVSDDENS